jgi:3-oxoacyl-[acyl-carrier protein] reductase
MDRLFNLDGKVAIVTGANHEIGAAMAEALADAGAAVLLAHHSEGERVALLVERIITSGGRAGSFRADLSTAAANRSLVERAVELFGRLDIFAANAGLTIFRPFLDMDEGSWNMVVDLNLKGSYFGAQAAARQMISQGQQDGFGGRIVFSTSVAGMQAGLELSAYGVTKAGLRFMARALGLELGQFGITVNAIGIGATLNERNLQNDPDYDAQWASAIPVGRVGLPSDAAHALLFLVSPAAAMVNGHTLVIDGGWTARGAMP